MRYLLSILLFFYFILPSFGQNQEVEDIGNPFLSLFPPKIYKGHPQIWCIEQDNNGVMYFGGGAVYTYDGVSWKTISIPQAIAIRALAKDTKGRIYVGTKNNFGYLTPTDSTAELEFISLSSYLVDSLQEFGDVWQIHADDKQVYFHTAKRIFRYSINNTTLSTKKIAETVSSISITGTALRGTLHKGNYYFHSLKDGLGFFHTKTNRFQKLDNTDTLAKPTVISILPYSDNELLIITQTGQLWKYNLSTKSISYFPTEIDSILQSLPPALLYHAIILKNKNILISTIFKGAFLINREGKLIKKIDKSNGIPTQTIPYVFEDQAENIWLATDNGIAKLELKTPFRIFREKETEIDGVVLTIQEFKNTLYLGTSKGIYYKDDNDTFKKIDGLDGFCWDIKMLDIKGKKQIYASAQDNLYHITTQKATKIAELKSANVITQFDKNKVLLSGEGGFSLLEFESVEKAKIIQNVSIQNVEIRSTCIFKDQVWFGTIQNGLYSFAYNSDSISSKQFVHIDSISGIPKGHPMTLFMQQNELLIGTEKGFYHLNPITQKIELHPTLGKNLTENHVIYKSIFLPTGDIYIVSPNLNNNIHYINLNEDRKVSQTPFYILPSMSTQSIYADTKNTVWIGGSEGLYRYYPQKAKQYNYNKISKPIIRQVFLGEDSLFFAGNYTDIEGNFLATQPQNAEPIFKYDNNSLTFHFAAPIFQEGVQYSYRLEGYDKELSNWTAETKKSYTNLHEGNYIFKVKAKNIYTTESEITTYSFEILPPWYKTWWAYLIYFVIGSFVIWGLIWINTQRLKKANQKLESTVKERTAELMERNEEIIQQNAQLNQQKEEIEAQNKIQTQLNSSLSIQKTEVEKAYKNIQLLSEIGQEITAILNFEALIKSVYQNVNSLMSANGFGIGIFDNKQARIGFQGFIEKGKKLPYHFDSLKENTLAVRCFTNLEEIVINDFEKEGAKYGYQIVKAKEGEIPMSLVYFPLQLDNKPLGVITVQSFEKNSYSERELTFLRSLASYVSIALDNSSAYKLITEKNQKITDSIRYAQTIQHAILPSDKKIEKPFRLSNDDYQIIFRPKDIVSGDFYWTSQSVDYFFIAAVDCTGHGVPGAFMSMIGSALLTEIVEIQKIYEPSLILDKFNNQFIEALRQDENANSDGMDVCLCRIKFDNPKVEVIFAGAKRSLFYVDYNENEPAKIERLQGTRKSVGGKQRNQDNFEQHILSLNKKSRIYLSTDGLVDQNNPQGEKFGTIKLIQFIENTLNLSIKAQVQNIENELIKHQQNAEQRDDITFIGIEV